MDTWWQTETGGILISPLPHISPQIPTFATNPLPGIEPVLMDENGKELNTNNTVGKLCIKEPWPSMARTIWGDHKRYVETYFSAFPGYYFTGDGAKRNDNGMYRITGRVDDVIIVSGHNLGTAPIEDAINEHPDVAESAIVGFPHDIKGNALYGFVTLKEGAEKAAQLESEINALISEKIGPIAKLDRIQFTSGLPKTRSGKIMRRILRKIAEGDFSNFGDISTLLNPEVVEEIKNGKNKMAIVPSDWLNVNRISWNQRTKLHINSDFYDVERFKKGKDSLNDIELQLLGNIDKQKILHLQCHFGMDTLSLERHGAFATGVDFSEDAISYANTLKKEMGLSSEFICSDIYDLDLTETHKFDMVFVAMAFVDGFRIYISGVKSFQNTCKKVQLLQLWTSTLQSGCLMTILKISDIPISMKNHTSK